ncbi:hypothetical protein BBF96_11615 [Anoxybacter fermentans]|uniref:Peptidase S55 domain-containing protein n=1 Tax=Anoxybacter fermentans TaxID=1323375 RepID=A0A3S9T0F8_9FIRM|nr:SpoIVB peptidase S55 domain-containing protein [Anoxybacter fermentans]AZR73980.1 hypothetical protein BBF96_11615 [Anoxybacter fermentans]
MKKLFFTVVIVYVLLILMQFTAIVLAQDEIMPITGIKKGMKGVGKTVISGVVVEEFDVEILGILKSQNQVGDLILVKVSGSLIERTGGIAAGMSGSPVYINGKLIGAIGYSWGLTDHTVGLVTPIESMLQVLEMDKQGEKKLKSNQMEYKYLQPNIKKSPESVNQGRKDKVVFFEPLQLKDRVVDRIYFCDSYHEALKISEEEDNALAAYPVKTPLLVNGLTGRALKYLINDLKSFDLVPIVTGGITISGSGVQSLEPGSAIAVQLVRGDINISAIGTLTYIKGKKILGFGHPFLKLGQVEYFLSGAEIMTVVNHQDMPFKLGVPTDLKGVITQDRNAGLGGRLDRLPKIIPVTVQVHDLDLDRKREIEFQVIRDEELVIPLVVNSVLQAIDTAIDRQGYGTSTVDIEIMADKLPDHIIQYNNMYFSNYDIAAQSLYDLYNLLNIIVTNPFDRVNLISINVNLQVKRARQVAIIEEAKLLNEKLKPGDTARVEVTLRPYRDTPFKQIFEIKIPENIQTGDASLSISGGIYGSYQDVEMYDSMNEQQQEQEQVPYVVGGHYKSLKELLDDYLNQYKNNELIIEILPYYVEVMEEQVQEKDYEGETSEKKSSNGEEASLSVKKTFKTDYVLEGGLTLEITISENDVTVEEIQSEEQKIIEKYKTQE